MKKGSIPLYFALSLPLLVFQMVKSGPSTDKLFNTNSEVKLEASAPPNADDCLTASAILSLITPKTAPDQGEPLINVPRILKENLYKHTTGPVTRRSLLDEPALMPDWLATDCWSLYAQLFYNYSPHVYFTENSPFIRSYIDLTNKNIVSELSEKDFIKANVPEVLGLFHNIKLQQHRLGFMFGVSKVFDMWAVTFRIPLYYLLEHFFLTEAERNRIKKSPFIKELQFTPSSSSKCNDNEAKVLQFGLRHLANDKVGLGDSRLNIAYNVFRTPCYHLWVGLRTTLPTAATFGKALLGGQCVQCTEVPPFNLKRLFNTYFCANGAVEQKLANAEIQRVATDFLVGALDRLSALLINTPLGNGKHFGAGPEFLFKYQWNECFSLQAFGAVEAFTKHKERHYFLVTKNPQEFDRPFRTDNEALAEANLAFLNQQIINTLFPRGVKIEVKPGIIAQAQCSLRYDTEHWHGSIGFDYWRQSAEKFGIICKGPNERLDIHRGLRPAAHQGKIFAGFGYYGITPCRSIGWHILVNADASVFNKGIGESYTLGILLGIDF